MNSINGMESPKLFGQTKNSEQIDTLTYRDVGNAIFRID